MNALDRLDHAFAAVRTEISPVRVGGRVVQVAPTHCRVRGLSSVLRLGEIVRFDTPGGDAIGEVIRIEPDEVLVKPYARRLPIGVGAWAYRQGGLALHPHLSWMGRVVDALGRPLDSRGPLPQGEQAIPLDRDPPPALGRGRVERPIRTGVKALDLFTPFCEGQRVGIFAGSGVGKSTLLAMIAGASAFDVVVLALVGERGREVHEFIADVLGADTEKAVVVVATGDDSPMMRRLAPKTATAIAEYYRDLGRSVLLVVDSITRFAHAAREVAMAAGEPAIARGYTPSVFTELPQLLERAGPGPVGKGSITAVYSVLVDGDDHNDPVADTVRGILDGHIVLARKIADAGRFPAVDLLGSISRLARSCWTCEQRELVLKLKDLIHRYEDTADLRAMGGYQSGVDPMLDKAVALVPGIYDALGQTPEERVTEDPFDLLARALVPRAGGSA